MNRIIELLGLLPNTSAIFRVKIVFVGIGALLAGSLFMASGIGGSLVQGGLMAACGAVLFVIACWNNGEQKANNDEIAIAPEKLDDIKLPVSISSCDHLWVDDDEMLNYEPKLYRCSKCDETFWG